MARVHCGGGILPIYKQTLPSESFIEKPCTVSELPTELEALKEKNQCVLVAKISFLETEKKSPIRKN